MCCVVSKNNVNSQQYHPRHSDSYLSHICYTVGSFDVRPNYVTNNNFSRISILRSTHCAKIKSTQNKHAIRYIHTHIHNFENVPTFDSHEPALVSHHLNMSGVTGGESTDYVSLAALPGIPAVPQKVAKKLLGGEYVDMAEMRPVAWRMEELTYARQSDAPSCPAGSRGANRKRMVTDIVPWMEYFSVMAAIITAKGDERAPHLFAYQRLIVRASQSFEGPAA